MTVISIDDLDFLGQCFPCWGAHIFLKPKGMLSWVAGGTPGSVGVVKGGILLSERPGFRPSPHLSWLSVTWGHGLPMPPPSNEVLRLRGGPPGQALHTLAG